MKKISIALALFVAACSSLSIGPLMKELKATPPVVADYKEAMELDLATAEYTPWLQKDYKALALFEYDEMYDYDSAERFAHKSNMAGSGKIPNPDAVSSQKIDPGYQQEAQAMHAAVLDAYARGKTYIYPRDVARLHVAYDCWLEQIEENIQPNHILRCKDIFYDALDKIKDVPPPPAPEIKLVPATVTLYFTTGSSSMAQSEIRKLEEVISNQAVARGQVIIDGYADTVDSSDYNLGLSQRRANAVKDLIQSLDPGIQNISIQAFGETNLAVSTADRVPEKHNRRVVVQFNEAALQQGGNP